MPTRIAAIAAVEFRIAYRNRWVHLASLLMGVFALALTFAGSAPTGALGVSLLTVSVASMTTLAVYLAPLLALLIAFDTITGEAERGGLGLLLCYPVSRGEILLGKFAAHLAVLGAAMLVGYGSGGLGAILLDDGNTDGWVSLSRLMGTSVLLGATFLALGYAISGIAGTTPAAAGLTVAIWLIFVVLYDLGLLGALVLDRGGVFTTRLFPWLLMLNPADAFRLWNVAGSDQVALASGMSGTVHALPSWAAPISLIAWPFLALLLSRLVFSRVRA